MSAHALFFLFKHFKEAEISETDILPVVQFKAIFSIYP